MRSHQVLAVAGALADDQRADQARDTGIDVHDRAAREVERASSGEPADSAGDFVELGLRRVLAAASVAAASALAALATSSGAATYQTQCAIG